MYLSSLNSRWIYEYLEWHESSLDDRQSPKTAENEIVENPQDRERCENKYDNSILIATLTGLSTRVRNGLKNISEDYEISTVGELRNIPDGVLLRIPNFGRKSLRELYDADVLWAGRITTQWRVLNEFLNEKIKKREEKREKSWRESWELLAQHRCTRLPSYEPESWDKYKNALNHWNHYGCWPNGSTDPEDSKLYIAK